VVEEDARLAVVAALVAEGVLDAGFVAGGSTREPVGAHRDRNVARVVDLVVLEDDLRPALAAVDCKATVLFDALIDGVGTNEVAHGRLAGRAERHIGGLGRLEEHVGVAVAIELCGGLARSGDVVLAVEERLADGLDGVRPTLLAFNHVRRCQGRHVDDLADLVVAAHDGPRWRIRHRRVVEEDARLAVVAALVAEGVLDAGFVAGGSTREPVGAHRDRNVARVVDLVVLEDDLRPALAAVDCKATVLFDALIDGVGTNEVAHGRLAGRAERHIGGLGRLEEHVGVAVAIELCGGLARSGDVVLAVEERLADGLDGIRPSHLACLNVLGRDGREVADDLAVVVVHTANKVAGLAHGSRRHLDRLCVQVFNERSDAGWRTTQ